jgi:putative sporulation protein YyaC
VNKLAKKLRNHIGNKDTVYVCIGTDRSTGDALGPLVGDRLKLLGYKVYGTTKDPIHAMNLEQKIQEIKDKHPDSIVVAIDAALGKHERVGAISVREGPVEPGVGVNVNLPSVGDCHISGVVNVAGFMGYMVLQNTRLSRVLDMAKKIVRIINIATAEPLVAATLERTIEQAKRNRLLELLQDAEGEEKSRILAQLVVLDEEMEREKIA